jgi:methionine aminopeptidase
MRHRIQVKTPDQLARMREAGLVVARTLEALRGAVRPGISTQELDEIAAATIRSEGAVPSFLGYIPSWLNLVRKPIGIADASQLASLILARARLTSSGIGSAAMTV